ncbi:hypothetical protein [Microbacterium memoriense]|uniref:Uncharacterized protein n=1 Tax=Microbacterium memoriense TaxID=2978350 RepID=A0ABT2PEP1_9MICO|nr:hypothetical protein [Microbacterium memoriense]MCT9002921.1 hypothetical protein [Microbacterium memoriense]
MNIRRAAATFAFALALVGLTACQGATEAGGDVIAPVTLDAGDLQGETVDLIVGQALNINTGDLAVDSYTGDVADPAIAEFVAGDAGGTAVMNPGVTALSVGSTDVTLTNTDAGIEDLTFTVVVAEKD